MIVSAIKNQIFKGYPFKNIFQSSLYEFDCWKDLMTNFIKIVRDKPQSILSEPIGWYLFHSTIWQIHSKEEVGGNTIRSEISASYIVIYAIKFLIC